MSRRCWPRCGLVVPDAVGRDRLTSARRCSAAGHARLARSGSSCRNAHTQSRGSDSWAGRPAEVLDPKQPLSDLGLDSLMAVELKNRIEAEFGVSVPVTSISKGPVA